MPPVDVSSPSVDDRMASSLLDVAILWMWRFGSVVIGIVAIAGGLLYAKQESLLYLPQVQGIPRHNHQNPQGYRNPTERGMKQWFNVRVVTEDQVQIHAWYLIHPEAMQKQAKDAPKLPTIIFFHGNAGNIGLRLPNARQMMQYLGCHVLLVEYRGYGDSDDKLSPNEEGLKRDAQAMYEWMASSSPASSASSLKSSTQELQDMGVSHFIDKKQLYVFGRSLGGAVAFSLAEYVVNKPNLPPIAGLIMENTFLSISAMVDKIFPFLKSIKPYVLRMHWNSQKIARKLHQTPILYLAGAKDDLVPHFHMKVLYQTSLVEAGNPRATMHIVPNGTHNETWVQGGAEYWKAFKQFMTECGKVAMQVSRAAMAETVGDDGANAIPTMSQKYMDMAKGALSSSGTSRDEDKKKS